MREIWLAGAAGLLGWALTGLVLIAVRRAEVLAPPTDRGLHATPTPVGGGLGLIGATLLLWAVAEWPLTIEMGRIVLALAALAALSWIDDRTPLPPLVRLLAQALVVLAMVWMLPQTVRIIPALPMGLERLGLVLGWLWLLNLTNFMDGIDGLAGVEAITVGLGYVLVSALAGSSGAPHLIDLALLLAAAASGYLVWNWAPARIFMGDVGSIPLGFLFGVLMLDLAQRGFWAAALILPLYFLADATLTLLDRLRRGAKPWQAHREHAYQRAVLAGMSHAVVTTHVALLNVALVALAVASTQEPWPALGAAAMLTAALFAWLRSRTATNP